MDSKVGLSKMCQLYILIHCNSSVSNLIVKIQPPRRRLRDLRVLSIEDDQYRVNRESIVLLLIIIKKQKNNNSNSHSNSNSNNTNTNNNGNNNNNNDNDNNNGIIFCPEPLPLAIFCPEPLLLAILMP